MDPLLESFGISYWISFGSVIGEFLDPLLVSYWGVVGELLGEFFLGGGNTEFGGHPPPLNISSRTAQETNFSRSWPLG